jgi:hypothetical protein
MAKSVANTNSDVQMPNASTARNRSSTSKNSSTSKPSGMIRKSKIESEEVSDSDIEELDAYTPRKISHTQTGCSSWRSTVRNHSSTFRNSSPLQHRGTIRKPAVESVVDSVNDSDIEELDEYSFQKSIAHIGYASRKSAARNNSSTSRNSFPLQPSGLIRKATVESAEGTDTESDIEGLYTRTPRKSTARHNSSTSRNSLPLQPSGLIRKATVNSAEGTDTESDSEELYTRAPRKSPVPTASGSPKSTARNSSSAFGKSSMLQPSGTIRKPTLEAVQDTNMDSDVDELNAYTPRESPTQSPSASRKVTVGKRSSTSRNSAKLQSSGMVNNNPTIESEEDIDSDIEEELYAERSQLHSPSVTLDRRREETPTTPRAPLFDDEILPGQEWWRQDMDAFHLAQTKQQKKNLDRLHAKFNLHVGRAPFNQNEPKLWDDSLKVVERWAPAGTTRIKAIEIANDFFKHERVWPSRRTAIDKLKKKLCRTDAVGRKVYQRSEMENIRRTSPLEETEEMEGDREWWRFGTMQQRNTLEKEEARKLKKLREDFIQHVGRMPFSEHEPRLWEEGLQIVKKWSHLSISPAQQMLIAKDYFDFTAEWPIFTSELKKFKEHLLDKDRRKTLENKRREDMVARKRIKEAVAINQQQQRSRTKHLHAVRSGRVERR